MSALEGSSLDKYLRTCQAKRVRPNSEVVKYLSTPKGKKPSASSFRLKNNYLGDRGAEALFEVAREDLLFEKFSSLDLSGQGLRDAATISLVELLKSCTHLRTLDLSDNVISTRAGRLLYRWALDSPKLIELNLIGTRVDSSLRRQLGVLLAARATENDLTFLKKQRPPPEQSKQKTKAETADERRFTLDYATLGAKSSFDNVKMISINPLYKVKEGKLDKMKELTKSLMVDAKSELGCLFYQWTFNTPKDDDAEASCREGYMDADSVRTRFENLSFDEILELCSPLSISIHGPIEGLNKLKLFFHKHPLPVSPEYFATMEV